MCIRDSANTEALGWGSTFSKNKSDYLDLQNEIATKLASELKGGLDADEAQQLAQKATENAEAQAEYQAGRREWNKRSKSGFDNAIKHYEKAIDLDPGYAQPYVGLADTFLMVPLYNFGKPDTMMPKVRIYAEKAIQINPNYAEAHFNLGVILKDLGKSKEAFDYCKKNINSILSTLNKRGPDKNDIFIDTI